MGLHFNITGCQICGWAVCLTEDQDVISTTEGICKRVSSKALSVKLLMG